MVNVMLMVLVVLLGAALSGLVVHVVRSGRTAAPSVEDSVRAAVADAQARAAADRDAAIQAALAQVLNANRELTDQQRRAAEDALGARQEAISTQVGEMRRDFARMAELVQQLEQQRREHDGRLDETLQTLHTSTRSLTDALASPQTRGQWGERAADDILRAAGFVEGVSYTKQKAVEGGRIPDFTFFLPDDRVLHMDVKFPASAYLRYLEAADDATKQREATSFLKDVRARVRELTGRDYIDPSRNTVEQVLCFIPNESIYGFILERDGSILEEAMRQGVVFCSPSTLFSVLCVIRQAADTLRVQEASDEILCTLATFSKQWDKFREHLDKVDRQLGTVQKSFTELTTTRVRQLEKPLDQLDSIRRQRGLDVLDVADDEEAPALRAVGDEPW